MNYRLRIGDKRGQSNRPQPRKNVPTRARIRVYLLYLIENVVFIFILSPFVPITVSFYFPMYTLSYSGTGDSLGTEQTPGQKRVSFATDTVSPFSPIYRAPYRRPQPNDLATVTT
jgi:hypothetical protein